MIKICGLFVLGFSLLLMSCSEADTLGDEPPDEIVIEGAPTWENGIGELVQLKCASCHQVPAVSYTPADTPMYFDLRYYEDQGNVPGAKTIFNIWSDNRTGSIQILRTDFAGKRKMPLEYATPLTIQEIESLEKWVQQSAILK